MTHFAKRITSAMLAVLLVLSVVIGTLPTAASAKTGTLVSNTGTRHETCTSLSSQAQAYYTGDYTWEKLSAMTGGNENCLDTDNELFEALHTLMSSTMTNSVTYKKLPEYWAKTDTTNGSSTNVFFYSDVVSTDNLNREHVWPKSHASFHEKDGGCDLHHLRPTNGGVNSSRGNLIMGNVKDEYSNHKTYSYQGDVVLYETSSLVEVNDNIKGDVARILLYVWCRWEEPNLFKDTPNPVLGAGDKKNDGQKVIESLETLLQWCALDPVDTWEMSRNDQVENIQGNRNVFIDYPELAWLVFGQDVPENITTPTNHTGVSGNPSTGGSSNGGNNNGGNDNNNGNNNGSTDNSDGLTMVTTPTAGTAFKLRMDKDTPLYFNGNVLKDTQPWYLGTTKNVSEATDVYVEAVSDGYKLYFYNRSNVKTYICVYQDGTHISLCINHSGNSSFYDSNGTTFAWDTDHNTFTATIGTDAYFIGTTGNYASFSANATSKISSGYPAHLYTTADHSGDNTTPTKPTESTTAPTQPEPTESTAAPTQPEPTESTVAPTHPEPTESTAVPTQPEPTEPTTAPTQPEPTESTAAPTQPEPTESTADPSKPAGDHTVTIVVVICAVALLGVAVFFLIRKKQGQ